MNCQLGTLLCGAYVCTKTRDRRRWIHNQHLWRTRAASALPTLQRTLERDPACRYRVPTTIQGRACFSRLLAGIDLNGVAVGQELRQASCMRHASYIMDRHCLDSLLVSLAMRVDICCS